MDSKALSRDQLAARGAALLAKQVERALTEIELTLPQYRLLSLLEGGGASATYAAERLAVSPPSITAIVDGLVTREMVRRRHVEGDRRRVELQLTATGASALRLADDAVSQRLGQVAAHGDPATRPGDALDTLTWWLDAIRREFASRQGSPA